MRRYARPRPHTPRHGDCRCAVCRQLDLAVPGVIQLEFPWSRPDAARPAQP